MYQVRLPDSVAARRTGHGDALSLRGGARRQRHGRRQVAAPHLQAVPLVLQLARHGAGARALPVRAQARLPRRTQHAPAARASARRQVVFPIIVIKSTSRDEESKQNFKSPKHFLGTYYFKF